MELRLGNGQIRYGADDPINRASNSGTKVQLVGALKRSHQERLLPHGYSRNLAGPPLLPLLYAAL
jgi:hypothetical protein